MPLKTAWPEGKAFAFTIFDDPDSQTLECGRQVYAFLADLGFRTTKGVWPVRGQRTPSDHGGTCAEKDYLAWVQQLQRQGFEIGLHNVTLHTSTREETIHGLDEFGRHFGHDPRSMANHYFAEEGIYWGDARLSGWRRAAYNALTLGKNRRYVGHVEGHPCFWGDLCKQRIRYVRSFVFAEINTLRVCPFMPYHDPERPYVNYWYCSSEGSNVRTFVDRIREAEQDRLEEEGGACIMYAHFGHGFYEHGSLAARFRELMARLSRRNGWFVPVSTLLDYLLSLKREAVIRPEERSRLELKWLLHKAWFGTA